jgi:hypothetical protein
VSLKARGASNPHEGYLAVSRSIRAEQFRSANGTGRVNLLFGPLKQPASESRLFAEVDSEKEPRSVS